MLVIAALLSLKQTDKAPTLPTSQSKTRSESWPIMLWPRVGFVTT